jgi:hypothetical protein
LHLFVDRLLLLLLLMAALLVVVSLVVVSSVSAVSVVVAPAVVVSVFMVMVTPAMVVVMVMVAVATVVQVVTDCLPALKSSGRGSAVGRWRLVGLLCCLLQGALLSRVRGLLWMLVVWGGEEVVPWVDSDMG